MAAARYWRIHGIATKGGGDLAWSALQLNAASGRVDQAATLTSSHVPSAGNLSDLSDSALSVCRFAASDVRSSGFWLQWDFGGVPQDVTSITVGSDTSQSTWSDSFDVSTSSDGVVWSLVAPANGILFPGSSANTTLVFGTMSAMRWAELGSAASVINADQTLWTAAGYTGSAARANASISAGKYYWELVLQVVNTSTGASGNALNFGVWPLSRPINTYIYNTSGVYRAYQQCAQGDVFGFAFDADIGTLRVYRQDALAATISGLAVGAGTPWAPVVGDDNAGGAQVLAKFKGPFTFSPPAGFAPVEGYGPGMGPRQPRPMRIGTIISASAASPSHSVRSYCATNARDIEFGGPGTIYGTTKTKGTPNQPAKARVVLQHHRSKLPVRETWSDPVTGAFAFTGIDTTQQFLTLAEDAAGNFRPVAANRLTPEVLP